MCAVSLAECALTTIAIIGKNKNINIDNTTCELVKVMQNNPRRISEIHCQFNFVNKYSEEETKWIEETAHNCPVARSMHPDLQQVMTFSYGKK